MNFLGIANKLEPWHIRWILYLNDKDLYKKQYRFQTDKACSPHLILLYSREKTIQLIEDYKLGSRAVGARRLCNELITAIEDADTNR